MIFVMGSGDNRIESLDGLRALAIGLVMMTHTTANFKAELLPLFPQAGDFSLYHVFYNGWCGVDLFFVLSGFLIMRQLLHARLENKHTRSAEIHHYLRKRFFRIAPAYYAILTVFLFLAIEVAGNARGPGEWAWTYLYHLLFLQDIFQPRAIEGFFWSIAVEIKFYLLAPLLTLLLLSQKAAARFGILAGILISMVAFRCFMVAGYEAPAGDATLYFFEKIRSRFWFSLDGLLGGAICAYLWSDEKIRAALQKKSAANTLFAAGTVLFLALVSFRPLFLDSAPFFDRALFTTAVSLGFSLMLLGLLGPCAARRFFSLKGFRAVALISYSLFLSHTFFYPVQRHVADTLSQFLDFETAWAISLAPYFGLSFILASILYLKIEKPFVDWSKRPAAEKIPSGAIL